MKILFVLKQNQSYNNYSTSPKAGLLNSASFVADIIGAVEGFDTKLVSVIDGNFINAEIHTYRPDITVLEAIWTTPAKVAELQKIYPSMLFIVRIHSRTSFLANEGIAIEWIKAYAQIPSVRISFNHPKTNDDYSDLNPVYLPNLYEPNLSHITLPKRDRVIDIGCFGAIRPMKNQLNQAIAAVLLGKTLGRTIRFHINAGRVEQKGENVLKNLRAFFQNSPHQLVEHGWMDRPGFLNLIDSMDICMQLSLSESFNIVAADGVSRGKPVVVSNAIDWMPTATRADHESAGDIARVMKYLLLNRNEVVAASQNALLDYNQKAFDTWMQFLQTENQLNALNV